MSNRASNNQVELNCDMGESLGRWKLADDEAIMPYIHVANIAAGFHASDPSTIHQTIILAKKYNVKVGAHPGFPDLIGFGRRTMQLSPQEVFDIIVYQSGAILGFCISLNIPLNHIKPHGALYFYLLSSREICTAAVKAIKIFNVPFYGLANTLHEEVAKEFDVSFVPEFFADIDYTSSGDLIPPAKSKKATPDDCVDRVKGISTSTSIHTAPLKNISYSVCLHSDMQGALDNVKAVRAAIDVINSDAK